MTPLDLGNMRHLILRVSSFCPQFRPSPGSEQGSEAVFLSGYCTTIRGELLINEPISSQILWGITVMVWESLS